MNTPTIIELRNAYWWACRYLDNMYKGGTLREYHTRTPFTQITYQKVDDIVWTLLHPIGLGVMTKFIECLSPVEWHAFSKIHGCWDYVHNTTRDYSMIALIGFEDTEPYWIVINPEGQTGWQPWGDEFPDQDCDEPLILVEYTRNRLKNGSFTFRMFWGVYPEDDLPAFWNVESSSDNMKVCLSEDSYEGPYSLKVWYKEAEAARYAGAYLENVDILPDTEYVLSMYFKGTVNYNSTVWGIWFYDAAGEFIDSVEEWLDYGEYKEWTNHELRFRTPTNAHHATVFLQIYAGAEPWPYSESTTYFDMFWLSECPLNLKPTYTILAQIVGYGGEKKADIYFNGQKIWDNVSLVYLPRDVFETEVPLDGIPSFRSAIRHSVQNGVFYYLYSSMHPDWQTRANALQAFRDKYGFTYDIYHPLWRETDTYPDDYMVSWDSVHDCDAWFTIPCNLTFYPYWSKMCQCRALSDSPTCGYFVNGWFWALAGMHILNKYGDPYKTVAFYPYPSGPCTEALIYSPIDAYQAVFTKNTYLTYGGYIVDPVNGIFAPYAEGVCLAFLAELGYGFREVLEANGDGALAEDARNWADMLAEWLLSHQWGWPYIHTSPSKYGFYKHEDFGEVNIPEFTGGFCTLIVYKNGEPHATSKTEYFAQLADILSMPAETAGIIAVNQEATFTALRGLQIYEWYKYKGGKGAFPKILMPADVNGDGKVDGIDLWLIKKTIEKGEYCALADVNGDGVVDENDYNLVKQALRTPITGTLWIPSESKVAWVKVVS